VEDHLFQDLELDNLDIVEHINQDIKLVEIQLVEIQLVEI